MYPVCFNQHYIFQFLIASCVYHLINHGMSSKTKFYKHRCLAKHGKGKKKLFCSRDGVTNYPRKAKKTAAKIARNIVLIVERTTNESESNEYLLWQRPVNGETSTAMVLVTWLGWNKSLFLFRYCQVYSPTCGSFRVFPPSRAMTAMTAMTRRTRAANWRMHWTNRKDCWPVGPSNASSTWQMFITNFPT